jgi:hypothetical protein
VSSCNKEEVPLALARLRHEGAIVTTSESFMYECCGDAGTPEYVLIFATTIAETGLMPYTRRSSLTDFHAGSSRSSRSSKITRRAPRMCSKNCVRYELDPGVRFPLPLHNSNTAKPTFQSSFSVLRATNSCYAARAASNPLVMSCISKPSRTFSISN